ncbi:MAG: DedA family protein [Cyanobacteria bacterium P01_H01_bin.130]
MPMLAIAEAINLDTIQAIIEQYGYWSVFFGIALENAGLPLPGETITLVGGFLAGSGDLQYAGVLGCAVSGAIIGDSCGYWLGRWGGWTFLSRLGKFFRISEEKLEATRDRFANNAGKAVFFGRFVALLRIFAGPLAGIVGMPYWKFFIFNASGALVWGSVIVTLAFTAGELVSLETLMGWVSNLGIAVAIVVVGAIALPFVVERMNAQAPE